MRNTRIHWIVLLGIVVLATMCRVYQLKDVPAGLYCDEAAEGYNAYAVGTTGYDEHGNFLPLFFWSFGGYKNPVYIYTAAAIMRGFGLDEFTTRLPAALFGVGGVVALFFLGRALFSPWVGLAAALLLALCPWHIHFSRIAFDMTSFALLVTVGYLLLCAFLRGRRTLPAAAFVFGLCVYAYAIATLFVPVFLAGFGLLYAPTLLRRWRQTLLAIVVALATVAPCGVFYYQHQQGSRYFHNTTAIKSHLDVRANAARVLGHYGEFFSASFLFERGDPIVRHAVRGFGELLPLRLPPLPWSLPAWFERVWPNWTSLAFNLLIIGVVAAVLRGRASALLLWWLALYPAGASLMTEIPSASRAFIGAPVFCLLIAAGLGSVLRGLGWLGRWRPLRLTLQGAALAGVAALFVPEAARYLEHYFHEYPIYSAPTYGGFQYGYRDSIQYMESERANYDILLLTATQANQPQIFPLFYKSIDPREWQDKHQSGYLVADPAYAGPDRAAQRILYQLHPSDLAYFQDYTIKKRIEAPGGQLAYVIAEVRKRTQFLTNWLALGLFDNANDLGLPRDFIDPQHLSRDGQYPGAFGPVSWRPLGLQGVRVNLNSAFASNDLKHIGNPEWVCAYVATTVHSETAQPDVFLEFAGSEDPIDVWFNGRRLTASSLMLDRVPQRRRIDLAAGNSLLLVKACESIGSWDFTVRITDRSGVDVAGLTTTAAIADAAAMPPAAPVEDAQLVEGFDNIVRFAHTDTYADYRGQTTSWWAYIRDPERDVVWRTAPCPERKLTVVAFTLSTAGETAAADLYVNGKLVLPFLLGSRSMNRTWAAGDYRMRFLPKAPAAGNSGVMVLVVPEADVTPGEPLEIRVVPTRGPQGAWFMIKSYRDTGAFEKLTAAGVLESLRGDWEKVAVATP